MPDIETVRNLELIERTKKLLQDVKSVGYSFSVVLSHGGVTLRGAYMEQDVYKPGSEAVEQLTRKWVLSPLMTDSEIVQTAFKCIWTSYEHRCRENFLYKGRRIFGPHFDVEDLVLLCETKENAGGRPPAKPWEEKVGK